MTAWLHALDEADRGFLTWLAAMVRLPIDDLLGTIEVVAEDERIRQLDLSALAPRVADRRQPLAPPFAGLDGLVRLDCTGLGLRRLDLTHLPTLEHLRCGDNGLRELDLSNIPALQTLDCSANALMTLDLRGLPALREVSCRENAIAILTVEPTAALLRLDCTHNQLMTLDLGEMPALAELRVTRNALVRLTGELPGLEGLEAGHNELPRVDLSACTRLRALCLAHNRLAQLDVPPSLRALDASHNYLAALDLQASDELVELTADHNQLVAIAWPADSQLRRIHLDDNRLASVAPPAGPTRVLTCDRNQLARLDASALPGLSKLSCAHNALTRLDLAGNPELVDLDVRDNRLSSLDLTGHPCLCFLMVDDGPALHTPDEPLFLAALPAPDADLSELGPLSLHRLALATWRTGPPERLHAIATHPRCDWGTALLLYWTHRPLRIPRQAPREALQPFEVPAWELLHAIEARATAGGFASRRCPFDPRDDRTTASVEGVDWTAEGDGLHTVPGALRQASTGPQISQPTSTTRSRHQAS